MDFFTVVEIDLPSLIQILLAFISDSLHLSSNHSKEERKLLQDRYLKNLERHGTQSNEQKYSSYLIQYEGKPDHSEDKYIIDIIDSIDNEEDDGRDINFSVAYLSVRAFIHRQTTTFDG